MIVLKHYEMNCGVVNVEDNESFEKVLAILMIPVQAYNAATNTYTVHVTYKMWSYILRECGFRNIELRLPEHREVVNLEEYRSFKACQKASKARYGYESFN